MSLEGSLKVLFVVGGLPFGGIENLLFDISLELRKGSIEFKYVDKLLNLYDSVLSGKLPSRKVL